VWIPSRVRHIFGALSGYAAAVPAQDAPAPTAPATSAAVAAPTVSATSAMVAALTVAATSAPVSGPDAQPPGHPADAAAERPSAGLDDLYDIARLADRLGVEHATVRVWLSRRVPWLPPPDGRLNGGAVWRAATLEGIEERRTPGRPGRKPKFMPDASAADVPRTNPAPTAPTAVVVADRAQRERRA
jgi:hypothetical protein